MAIPIGGLTLLLIVVAILAFALLSSLIFRLVRGRVKPDPNSLNPRTLEALGISRLARTPAQNLELRQWQMQRREGVNRLPEAAPEGVEGEQLPSYQAAGKDAMVDTLPPPPDVDAIELPPPAVIRNEPPPMYDARSEVV